MHPVTGDHVAVVGGHQVLHDHLDGVDGQRVGVIAVGGGHIGLDGVGHGVHAGVGHQLLGHGLGQLRIDDGHVGGDFKVRDGVLDTLLVVGDDGERGHLCGRAAGGGHRTEVGLAPQLGDPEHLAHVLEGALRILVLDPHGLGRVDGAAAADGHDPVGAEVLHDRRALHDGVHGRIALDALEQGHLHAGFLQIFLCTIQEAKALHRAAAHADDGLLALQALQILQSALAEVDVPGESKTCHSTFLLMIIINGFYRCCQNISFKDHTLPLP